MTEHVKAADKEVVTVVLYCQQFVTQCQVQSYSFSYTISPFKSSQASLMFQYCISMATSDELVRFKALCTMAFPQKYTHHHQRSHSQIYTQFKATLISLQ